MKRITIEDIAFLVFIAIIIAAALWLLHGSPPEIDAVISIGIAVAGSELLIWKKLFSIENKTSVSFMRLKNDMDKRISQTEHGFDNKFAQIEINMDKKFIGLRSNFEKNNLRVLNKLEKIENKLGKK